MSQGNNYYTSLHPGDFHELITTNYYEIINTSINTSNRQKQEILLPIFEKAANSL